MPINEMPGCRVTARLDGPTRRPRLAAVKSAVLGVPAAALLMSAGAASAATMQQAATHAVHAARQATAAKVSWHHLNLINGWQTASGRGSPVYAISNGAVYLTGGLTQPTPGSPVFAVLPKAARPRQNMYRLLSGFAGAAMTLFIRPNGTMEVTSDPVSNAQQFTSLAGVSFPVAGTTWHKLNLINGWKSASKVAGTGDPAYAVKNGIVYLSGAIKQLAGDTQITFAVLPKAATAGMKMYLPDYASGGITGTLTIAGTGAMSTSAPGTAAQMLTSLAAISYPARGTTWHTLPLINGWTSTPFGTGRPAYAVKNGVVYLSGALKQPSGTNIQFAHTPSAIRPPHVLGMLILAKGGYGYFAVGPVPRLDVASNSTGNTRKFASLAGINYPLNS